MDGLSNFEIYTCHTLGCVQPRIEEVYDLELIEKVVQSKCQEDWLKMCQ